MTNPISSAPARCGLACCNKKLGITDIKCNQCFKTHCFSHFRPEQHGCEKLQEMKERRQKELSDQLTAQATVDKKINKIEEV